MRIIASFFYGGKRFNWYSVVLFHSEPPPYVTSEETEPLIICAQVTALLPTTETLLQSVDDFRFQGLLEKKADGGLSSQYVNRASSSLLKKNHNGIGLSTMDSKHSSQTKERLNKPLHLTTSSI